MNKVLTCSILSILLTLLLSSCCTAGNEPPARPVTASLPEGSVPENWKLKDFPDCLDGKWPTLREEYFLLAGTELENTVTVLCGEGDGPVIYLVAGIHGDEKAGWIAGNLLKEADLKAGTLCIVSPANSYGAEHDRRTTKSDRDLNRNFPGNPEGWDAEQIADAIYSDIRERAPVLLLDLHEAQAKQENRDALGNTLICQSLDGMGELVLELLVETELGGLCAVPFSLYGSPPNGSINRVVTLELGIPSITVETYREEELSLRVRNQLEIVQYILSYYRMI